MLCCRVAATWSCSRACVCKVHGFGLGLPSLCPGRPSTLFGFGFRVSGFFFSLKTRSSEWKRQDMEFAERVRVEGGRGLGSATVSALAARP